MRVNLARSLALLIALAGVLLVGGGDGWARAKRGKHGPRASSHSSAVGRYHLRKANALAGSNKCAQAVREYTRAYDKLHDPVLLFNRAECYRRMGEDQKAAADYRVFLDEYPRAPNRAQIEARIAELEGTAAPIIDSPPPPEAKSEPKPRARPIEPPAPLPAATSPPPAPLVAKAPSQRKLEPDFPPEARAGDAVPEPPRPRPLEAAPVPRPPVALAVEDTSAAPILIETRRQPAADRRGSSGSHWWIFVALGVVVAGGAAAGYVLLRPKGQIIPATDLGDYRF